MKTRYIKFKGEHKALVDGDYYTYKQLAATIGANYSCIKERLSSKEYVTDDDLYPPHSRSGGRAKKKDKPITRLETDSMVISQAWLKRRL